MLHQDLGPVDALRAKRPKRLPTVLTKDETLRLIGCLSGTHQLMAKLIYDSGIRLMECLRLRIKDLEFDRQALIVRDGKEAQDRVTVLPDSIIPLLKEHLQRVKALHKQDLARGYGAVYLPDALARKYPHADREWGWQYVFLASRLSQDPRSGVTRRHHLHESSLQKAIKEAARLAGIVKPVGPHTLRHCFATHLLEAHYDIRTGWTYRYRQFESPSPLFDWAVTHPLDEANDWLNTVEQRKGALDAYWQDNRWLEVPNAEIEPFVNAVQQLTALFECSACSQLLGYDHDREIYFCAECSEQETIPFQVPAYWFVRKR